MKLIQSEAKYIPQENGLEGIYKQIELAGRTCYKSEDKITEDSAKGFVDRMIKSKHYAMLEHGTIYLKFKTVKSAINPLDKYYHNKYSKIRTESEHGINSIKEVFVTTNLRVLVENNWLDDLQYLCEPTEYHEKRYTFKFTTDQGVLREITKHRVFSFAVESTRYCNYSKDKFDNEITFIMPCWMDEEELASYGPYHTVCRSKTPESVFIASLNNAEQDYKALINMGWKPQQARNVLPLATKCDMFMTGFVSDWPHFFDLRLFGTTGKPHPDMELLALKASKEAIKANIINDIVSNPNNIKI